MHRIFCYLLLIVVVSCSPKVRPSPTSTVEEAVGKEKAAGFPYQASFTCDGKTYVIDSLTIHTLYSSSRECLAYHGMIGNDDANEIIAWLIRNKGNRHKLFKGLGRSISSFRGPIVFEALLSRMGDHELYVDEPQKGEGQPFWQPGATPSKTFARYAYNMLETVDGLELSEYIFREEGIDLIDDKLDILLYEHSNRYSIWLEKHLKDAWEKGLIKLKPYGKE